MEVIIKRSVMYFKIVFLTYLFCSVYQRNIEIMSNKKKYVVYIINDIFYFQVH